MDENNSHGKAKAVLAIRRRGCRDGRLRGRCRRADGALRRAGLALLCNPFHLPYAFDIGAGSSRLTWQASGGIGYQSGWAGVTLGYRHLAYEQGSDKLVQDLSFSGPFIALNISF